MVLQGSYHILYRMEPNGTNGNIVPSIYFLPCQKLGSVLDLTIGKHYGKKVIN